MKYIVGVDGGGSTCRLALADGRGHILGQAKSGPANIRTDLQGAYENIMSALHEAASQAGIPSEQAVDAVAVLGLAGANVGDYAQQLKLRLPFRDTLIAGDGTIAIYGALGAYDGVVGIVGTGSVFAIRRTDRIRTIGGWGFQIGDLGGGARLGRQLLEETLLAYDGVRPASPLTDEVMAEFEAEPGRLVERVRDAAPELYASFVPKLTRAADEGDEVANAILDAGCRDVERMLHAILAEDIDRLCLLGGLASAYTPRLDASYRRLLKPAMGDALQGALQLALEHAGRPRGAADE